MAYQVTVSENKNIITGVIKSVSYQVRREDGSLFADCGQDKLRAERVAKALNCGEDEGAVAWAY